MAEYKVARTGHASSSDDDLGIEQEVCPESHALFEPTGHRVLPLRVGEVQEDQTDREGSKEVSAFERRLYDRSLAHVNRWHTQISLRKESVAEHQYFVASNAMLICHYLQYYKIATPSLRKVLGMALVHDSLELLTGDMPGDFKKDQPALKAALNAAESEILRQAYKDMPPDIAYEYMMLHREYNGRLCIEAQIVKFCDVLDLAAFVKLEQGMGNTMLNRVQVVAEQWLQEFDWPWLRELKKCLSL